MTFLVCTHQSFNFTTQASRVLSQALLSAAILGVVSGFFIDKYGVQLLSLLGATPDYMEPALTYLRIRVLSGKINLQAHTRLLPWIYWWGFEIYLQYVSNLMHCFHGESSILCI
jgi:Na+-driven multidrug efflux pump